MVQDVKRNAGRTVVTTVQLQKHKSQAAVICARDDEHAGVHNRYDSFGKRRRQRFVSCAGFYTAPKFVGERMGAGVIKLSVDNKDVTKYLESLTWSGDMDSAARALKATFVKGFKPECGDAVKFWEDDKLLFKGKVYYADSDKHRNSLEAYDRGFYIANNYIWGEFSGTPTQIAKKVCADHGVKIGELAKTTSKTKVTATGDMTLFGVIQQAYEGEDNSPWRQYQVSFDTSDKIHIEKVGAAVVGTVTDLVIDGQRSWDIQNMVNRVHILDKDGKKRTGTIEYSPDRSKYGTLTQVYKEEEGKNAKTEAAKLLQTLSKAGTVSCIGSYRYVSGKAIKLVNADIGFEGTYKLASDSHTWTASGGHTMELDFYFAGDKVSPTSSTSKAYDTSGGTKKSAYVTGYCACKQCNGSYSHTSSNGVYTSTSSGIKLYNKASYGGKYCAITSKMRKDGVKYVLYNNILYEAVDAHGTKKQDQYRVDIFVPAHSECNKIGAGWRTIYCFKSKPKQKVVEASSDSSKVSSSDSEARTRAKIVSQAKKHKGESYSVTDCSDLVEKTFKEIGANIFPGQVAAEELRTCEKAGVVKSMTKSRVTSTLEKGDLIFWTGNSSRYKKIGHVGIYIGSGKIIDASSAKGKVVERDVWQSGKYKIIYYANSYNLLKKKGKI